MSSQTTVNLTFTTGVCECIFAAFACTQSVQWFRFGLLFSSFSPLFLRLVEGGLGVGCRGCGFGVLVGVAIADGGAGVMASIARRAKQGETDRRNSGNRSTASRNPFTLLVPEVIMCDAALARLPLGIAGRGCSLGAMALAVHLLCYCDVVSASVFKARRFGQTMKQHHVWRCPHCRTARTCRRRRRHPTGALLEGWQNKTPSKRTGMTRLVRPRLSGKSTVGNLETDVPRCPKCEHCQGRKKALDIRLPVPEKGLSRTWR